ncbi:hypothetical protein Q8A73_013513 [Channa argus]|nr:hypothetical protein Q8A73_013513 [Channa argus]
MSRCLSPGNQAELVLLWRSSAVPGYRFHCTNRCGLGAPEEKKTNRAPTGVRLSPPQPAPGGGIKRRELCMCCLSSLPHKEEEEVCCCRNVKLKVCAAHRAPTLFLCRSLRSDPLVRNSREEEGGGIQTVKRHKTTVGSVPNRADTQWIL